MHNGQVRLYMGSNQKVIYTNWKGETAIRTICIQYVWFGSTEYHPEDQWLARVYDIEKKAMRDFALADMKPYVWGKQE